MPAATTDTLGVKTAADFPSWYHSITLPDGTVTPGTGPKFAEKAWKVYGLPEDLTGKTVLDVGAWDGYWTFEALKRGAKYVVAIDDFSDRKEGDWCVDGQQEWDTFDFCRHQFGYLSDRCTREQLSVYDLQDASEFTDFDIIFCFGVMYHLRYPLLGLDKMAEVCAPGGQIFIESAVSDFYSPYRGGLGNGYCLGQYVMEFYPGADYGGRHSNWWGPTLLCLGHMVRAAGFDQVESSFLTVTPRKLADCRGFVHGTKKGG